MDPYFATTDSAVAAVRQAAAGVGSLPANIQGDVAQVLADITPTKLTELHENVSSAQDDLAITDSYGTVISDMITLSDQVVVMTKRPGRIKERTRVPLSRPRNVFEIYLEPGFDDAYAALWKHFKAEMSADQS